MKNITFKILCSLAAVAAFGGTLYISIVAHAQDELVDEEGNPVSENSVIADKFVGEIETLDNVKLSPQVFSNDVFKSLVDYSRPLPDEVKGRTNPFAPIN